MKKKPLLVFLIPNGTSRNELRKNLVDGGMGQFHDILAARLSTKKTIKKDVLSAIENGEMVAGIIIEDGGTLDWECNIPIVKHPGAMEDWLQWYRYSISNLVLYYGRRMIQGMQVLPD